MLLAVCFIGYIFPKIRENQDKQPQLPIIGNDLNHHVAPFSFVNQDGKTTAPHGGIFLCYLQRHVP